MSMPASAAPAAVAVGHRREPIPAGLSRAEAQRRLAEHGYNELPAKERRPQRPLLLVTAFATRELADEAARAGVRHCIEKAFDIEAVARIADENLQD